MQEPLLKNDYEFSRAVFAPQDFKNGAFIKSSVINPIKDYGISVNCLNLLSKFEDIHKINRDIEKEKNKRGRNLIYKGYIKTKYCDIKAVKTKNLSLQFKHNPKSHYSHYDIKLNKNIKIPKNDIEYDYIRDKITEVFSNLVSEK
jgi:hypothetical protein